VINDIVVRVVIRLGASVPLIFGQVIGVASRLHITPAREGVQRDTDQPMRVLPLALCLIAFMSGLYFIGRAYEEYLNPRLRRRV
jgi:hypothetical protein